MHRFSATSDSSDGRLVVLDGIYCEVVNVLSIASAASATASACCLSADVRSVESALEYCPDDDWAQVMPVPPAPFTPARRALVLAQEGRVSARYFIARSVHARESERGQCVCRERCALVRAVGVHHIRLDRGRLRACASGASRLLWMTSGLELRPSWSWSSASRPSTPTTVTPFAAHALNLYTRFFRIQGFYVVHASGMIRR
jgi:hypothetical protein